MYVLYSFSQSCLHIIHDMIYVIHGNYIFYIVISLSLSLAQINIYLYKAFNSKFPVVDYIYYAYSSIRGFGKRDWYRVRMKRIVEINWISNRWRKPEWLYNSNNTKHNAPPFLWTLFHFINNMHCDKIAVCGFVMLCWLCLKIAHFFYIIIIVKITKL